MRNAAAVIACVAALSTGCGGGAVGGGPNPGTADGMRVADTAPKLRAFLRQHGVNMSKTSHDDEALPAAWEAFREFSRLPMAASELDDDPMADALLFEFGVFGTYDERGETFRVSLSRQVLLRDGDIRQVHLVAHFPVAVGEQILSDLRASPCGEEPCAALCSYDEEALVGTPCELSADGRGERPIESAYVWSYDTGGESPRTQFASWRQFVAQSDVFRQALRRSGQLLDLEVWQESVE